MGKKETWVAMDTPTINEVTQIINELARDVYPMIAWVEPEFIITFRNGAEMSNGNPIFAKCEAIPEKYAEHMDGDLLLWVDQQYWEATEYETHVAMIDHALAYVLFIDDDMKVKTRKPDFYEFSDVLARRGFWSAPLKSSKRRMDAIQPELFDTKDYKKEPGLRVRAMKVEDDVFIDQKLINDARQVIYQLNGISKERLQSILKITDAPNAERLIKKLEKLGFITFESGKLRMTPEAKAEFEALEKMKGTEITFHGDPNSFAGQVAQEMKNQGLDVKGFGLSGEDKALSIARKLKAQGVEFLTGEK